MYSMCVTDSFCMILFSAHQNTQSKTSTKSWQAWLRPWEWPTVPSLMFQLLDYIQQQLRINAFGVTATTNSEGSNPEPEVQIRMCDVSGMNHDQCITVCANESRMDRNCIRLTSGRTDLGSYDESTNMANHANYNDTLGQYKEFGDTNLCCVTLQSRSAIFSKYVRTIR